MSVLNTKVIRIEKGLSISKLSYKSNIARGYLSELENGKYNNPSLQVICKLCKSLKVTPNELIDESIWKWED